MDDIRRIGPATPISRRGSGIDLSVPLNAMPTRAWWRTFQDPDEWQEPCHPSRITMKYRALIFTCEEWRIPLWITEIDKWITLANQRHGEYAQSRVRAVGCGA
jgi:hypothetical protein